MRSVRVVPRSAKEMEQKRAYGCNTSDLTGGHTGLKMASNWLLAVAHKGLRVSNKGAYG